MKKTITYLVAAGALALAALFPVAASADDHRHHQGNHHGHHHGYGNHWADNGRDWNDDDWDDHGPSWVGHDSWGGRPGYGVYIAPNYGYYGNPYQCFAPGYGWYPCPYEGYGY
jgi:hypothetical protein